MLELLSMILLLSTINISHVNSYNINQRIHDTPDTGSLKLLSNRLMGEVDVNRCVPIQAIKTMGCILATEETPFEGKYQSICEHHELCYTCGFAHSLSREHCDRLTLLAVYDLCSKNASSLSMNCLEETFSKVVVLQKFGYRSYSDNRGFYFECRQQCVLNYLQS